MDRLFLTILNMSISASFCVLAVMFVRLLMRRMPKIFSYLLWTVVMIRFVCPILPEAEFGLIPDIRLTKNGFWQTGNSEMIYTYYSAGEQGQSRAEEAHGGFSAGVDTNAGSDIREDTETEFLFLPDERIKTRTFPDFVKEKELNAAAWIWGTAALGALGYACVGYVVFLRRIRRKEVMAPCVAGFLHPMVYLPDGLDEMQEQLVLEHEKIHIKRLDYLVKPLAFLVCCIHWFNPLAWVFFFLMERDMEISCDEAVIQKIGYDRRRDYANTLLNLSQNRGWKTGYPIAFGENHVKSRIKGVVKMKKTGVGVSAAAVVLILAAAVFLLTNRPEENMQEPEPVTASYQPDEKTAVKESELSKGEMDPEEDWYLNDKVDTVIRTEEPEEKGAFGLPDIKENIYFADEDFTRESGAADIQSSETGNQETIMNYDPGRARDQFEVLELPQVDEAFPDTEILFSYPVEGARISDGYGGRVHPVSGDVLFHLGVDFAAEQGTPVAAAADGTVVRTGFDAECGNYLILLHENGTATYYSHCQDILAEEGKKVKSKEQIATVGNTGKSTGAHLHFAVSREGAYVEPEFEP